MTVLRLAPEDGTQPLFHFQKHSRLPAGTFVIYNESCNKIYACREVPSEAEQHAESLSGIMLSFWLGV
jgi:hypothetical protein